MSDKPVPYMHGLCKEETFTKAEVAASVREQRGFFRNMWCHTCGGMFPAAEFTWRDGLKLGR